MAGSETDTHELRDVSREGGVCVTLVPKRIRHLAALWSGVLFVMALDLNVPVALLLGLGFVALVLLVYDCYNSGYEEALEAADAREDSDE